MKCCPLKNSPERVCSGMKNITGWTTETLKSFQVENRGGGGEVGWMWPQGSLRTLKHRSLSLTELQFGLLSNTTEKRAALMELMDDIQSKWCGQKKNESFHPKDLGWRNKKKGRLSSVKVIMVHSLDSVLVFGSRFGCWLMLKVRSQTTTH